MSAKGNGGPAFPRSFSKAGEYRDSAKHNAQEGMTLRDYFAAKAMEGMLSGKAGDDFVSRVGAGCLIAYEIADAMLAERAK